MSLKEKILIAVIGLAGFFVNAQNTNDAQLQKLEVPKKASSTQSQTVATTNTQTTSKNSNTSMNAAEAFKFELEKLLGQAVRDKQGKVLHVIENQSQTHSKEHYVMVRVKNFKIRKNEKGRIRVVLWDGPENYGKENMKPFRSSSYWAKEAPNGEMIFKIGGLEIGKQYAFFAHFDKSNNGKVNRLFGIPTEPYIFSNNKNQGKGPGLTREGLSPPKYENTLVTYTTPGQEIEMSF
ncbi:MAG: DUF2141 domain-containing protein [Myxococcales bacterium]|nr:DUF2141 domain-containing protein [Myxococcales bacterium]